MSHLTRSLLLVVGVAVDFHLIHPNFVKNAILNPLSFSS